MTVQIPTTIQWGNRLEKVIWRWRKSNSLLAGYFLNFLPHKITFLTCPSIYFKSEASYVKLGMKTFPMCQIIGLLTIKMAIINVEQLMPGKITVLKDLGHFSPNCDPNKTNILGVIRTAFLIDGTIVIAMNHFQVLIPSANGIQSKWRLQFTIITIMKLKNTGNRKTARPAHEQKSWPYFMIWKSEFWNKYIVFWTWSNLWKLRSSWCRRSLQQSHLLKSSTKFSIKCFNVLLVTFLLTNTIIIKLLPVLLDLISGWRWSRKCFAWRCTHSSGDNMLNVIWRGHF